MKFYYRGLLPITVASLFLSGCIDDKYDLNDIDTTVKVQVNDLVVPVNIDKATLRNIFNLKEDSKIKEVDGEYAFVDDGDFASDEITINRVLIDSPNITPTNNQINVPSGAWDNIGSTNVSLNISSLGQNSFNAETHNVSDYIVSIDRVGCTMKFRISLQAKGLEDYVRNLHIRDLKFQLPKGMTTANGPGSYDPKTGVYNVGNINGNGAKIDISFDVTAIEADNSDIVYDYQNHHIRFGSRLGIIGGHLDFSAGDLKVSASRLPSSFSLVTAYSVSDIDINTFSGDMKYDIDSFDVSEIQLTDLPDVLTGNDTDIRIANPQIYFSVTNPLSAYKVYAQTGMAITSWKGDTRVGTYALDAPGYFTIYGTKGNERLNYYLSPSAVQKPYPGYADATHVGYAALSRVLSGNGVPSSLTVDFTGAKVPVQHVDNLRLGVNLGRVNGNYTFFAPLALGAGTSIVYSDVVDGWNSEDLDHLVIQQLTITATVNTDFPIPLSFTGYPIDVDGNQINNVEIVGAELPAHAQGQQIEIRITGEVTRLDGIRFVAKVRTENNTEALSPDMSITMSDIRPRVTGYYEKEL